jgi:nitric oxide reductase activation protein
MPSPEDPSANAPGAEVGRQRFRRSAEHHGFSLRKVTWGYRDIFAKILEHLFEEGELGGSRQAATDQLFDLLQKADQNCFDHVLKELLTSLNPRTRWMLELPGLFGDVLQLGADLAESRIAYGIGTFRALGEGGLGQTPAEVRLLIDQARRLREVADELAFAFIRGYGSLSDRLRPEEIEQYVRQGMRIYAGNAKAGVGFMACETKASENVIRTLTRESRLEEVSPTLEALLKALTGTEVEVDHLGKLDSDHLIERGAQVVCMYRWLFLPARVRQFDDAEENRRWYLLQTLSAAALLWWRSFPAVHGHPEYETLWDLSARDLRAANLVQALEYCRALRRASAAWPGARRLIRYGARVEFAQLPPRTDPDRLLRDLLLPESAPAGTRDLLDDARSRLDELPNVFATYNALPALDGLAAAYPGIDSTMLRTVSFLPDFFYPGEVSSPPPDTLVADLKDAAEQRSAERDEGEEEDASASSKTRSAADGETGEDGDAEAGGPAVAYVYDEWCQPEDDYYEGYCYLREERVEPGGEAAAPEPGPEAARVRQAFERLRPDLLRKERRLEEGDIINPDLLVEYLVDRRREPAPPIRFYEKTRVQLRDLAVMILLDASGSTAEQAGGERVIDVEKRAAFLLAEGLEALGDRFAVCGFSSHGRQDCAFYVYKDFEDGWREHGRKALEAARPSNATRMGVALRHAGWRLSQVECRQRLILLMTDGKPMDSDYDPNTRYAQHDVRMACEENLRADVHTIGISTEENTLGDMEIMFPRRRFALLDDIRDLPRILPRLYLRLAT